MSITESLYCPEHFVPAPSTMASFQDSSQFPWMEVALKEYRVTETRGRRHNPRIVEYHSACRGSTNDDETAWCSSFVNWVMREIGVEGTRRGNARSWSTWGTSIPKTAPQYGAVAVLWRGSERSWKGHVGFFVGVSQGRIILLGGNQPSGNQGDAVSLHSYPQRRLLEYRWPSDFPAPNMSYAN